MRKIREVLRLKYEARLSDKQIAQSVGCARSTAQECLRRARAAGIGWPLPLDVDDAALIAQLYPSEAEVVAYPPPDFAGVHAELRRKGVTRKLLWQEYRAQHADGCSYSAFCRDYESWRRTQDLAMRTEYRGGEKAFVDYAGQTMPIVDPVTGELRQAQIFVGVLGASHYVFAEATWTQQSADWLGSHVRMLTFFGGVVELIVPDNLRSGVHKACRYDPELNPSYRDFAEHYGVAILPARVRKPRDKAKVETGVQIVERELLAPLRHCVFFSLAELNAALAERLTALNARPMSRNGDSRHARFEALDRPALRPLPSQPYEFATWRQAKVHRDYHIQIERAFYSVPYRLIDRRVDVRLSANTVEIFDQGQLVAAHIRAARPGSVLTIAAHRAPQHDAMLQRTRQQLQARALTIGPATAAMITAQFERKQHPEEAFRRCQGILRLSQDFNVAALEQACAQALDLKLFSYRSIRALLQHPVPATPDAAPPSPTHEHVRGATYFH